jgi:hypothetical protein
VGEAKDIARFAVPTGRVQIDLAIRGETGHIVDTHARDVDVPDWQSSARPGPKLLPAEIVRTRTTRDAQRLEANADATPTASRTFARTNRLLIRTPAFDPGGAPVQIHTRLLNRAGRPLYDIPALALEGATNDRPAQFALPLAGLAPDLYQLEIIASNASGKTTNRVGFRIVN